MEKPSKFRDMSGTTLALTSLAVLGAAAVASTPLWLYYRRKRKRTDALVSTPPPAAEPPEPGPDTSSR
jgi:hypothetical protein